MMECFERCVMTGLPNQPRYVTPIHKLWDNCRTQFEDTRFECGLWLWFKTYTFGSLRPFGPGSNVALGSKRTRLCRFAAPVYLTNQEIMSHPYIPFGTIVARGSGTHGSPEAFGSLRPFGPCLNVARGSRTRGSRTRGSSVAFGSLRPLGPGSNVARGSTLGQVSHAVRGHAVRMWGA